MTELLAFQSPPLKAGEMMGTKVTNSQGESLGEIKELVIDPHGGRVAYVVVSFGALFGMGEKLFAIPFAAFAYDAAKNHYILYVPKQRLEDAPGFDHHHWPSMADEQWNRDLHDYYKHPPYWE